MTHSKCVVCKKRIKDGLILCKEHIQELRDGFRYGIGGKEVSKKKYDTIVKRGYLIPEEIEDIRLKDEKENNNEKE